MASRADQADKKTMGDAEQALEECVLLEADLAELKAKYEQFFLGVDRMPPSKMHEGVRRRVLALKGLFLRQTAVKFRVQALAAKLTTFERLWDRTLKEIEAGTYRRDLFKAKLHQQKRKQPAGEKGEKAGASDDFHVDEDLDLSDLDGGDDDLEAVIAQATEAVSQKAPAPAVAPVVSRPVVTPAPPVKPVLTAAPLPGVKPVLPNASPPVKPVVTAALPPLPAIAPPKPVTAPPRPGTVTGARPAATAAPAEPRAAPAPAGTGPAGGLSDQKIKAIFEAYVMAKKRCGEDTRALTLDSVSSSLKKQVPELMKQHNAKSVEFKVVIKDGKAVLRALPKDS